MLGGSQLLKQGSSLGFPYGFQISASYLGLLWAERASPSSQALTASFSTWLLQGPATPGRELVRPARAHTQPAPCLFLFFLPLPSYPP